MSEGAQREGRSVNGGEATLDADPAEGARLDPIDPDAFRATLEKHVDLIIDGGHCGLEPTTVLAIDEDGQVEVRRAGRGSLAFLGDDAARSRSSDKTRGQA